MNFREIVAFRAVIFTNSITRAAEVLNVTQPAVSMLISNLEESLGFKLFERRQGRIFPTPEALLLADEAEKTFESLSNLKRRADQIARRGVGSLRIASIYGPAMHLLPCVAAAFSRSHPEVNVSIVTRESKRIQEWMATQHYDLGIAEMPTEPNPLLHFEALPQRLVCVLPAGHPLADREILTPGILDGQPIVTMPVWHHSTVSLERAFAEAGARFNRAFEVDMFSVALELVAHGAGLALADPINLLAAQSDAIAVRPFEPVIHFDLALFFPAQRARSLVAEEFAHLLRKELASVPGL
ncbi:LysR family transcriptional regulator [Pseudaminobacter arsenicus]|uniref:LysR family transcriptional regulator n=1 Tax=Borborobacter arsenicus TaxID=1851146 RepID=A0A432VBP9_9HYPH|nr:LysR substrate-binding domain-containing protein [Pseudaminobacter arsenicus]RUM99523.1 LysR family transcriptional regulator [Pseudaminobacter arsenicus]